MTNMSAIEEMETGNNTEELEVECQDEGKQEIVDESKQPLSIEKCSDVSMVGPLVLADDKCESLCLKSVLPLVAKDTSSKNVLSDSHESDRDRTSPTNVQSMKGHESDLYPCSNLCYSDNPGELCHIDKDNVDGTLHADSGDRDVRESVEQNLQHGENDEKSNHGDVDNMETDTSTNYKSLPQFDFVSQPIQIAMTQNISTSKDVFFKGCEWSPDGLCIATNSEDNILRIFNLPSNSNTLYGECDQEESMVPVLKMLEGEIIYDFSWYPMMSSYDPTTCCLLSTSKDHPVHLWDAYTGAVRCSYRAYNHLDEITSANSVSFNVDGSKIYCGFSKMVRIFDTSRPGRNFEERATSGKQNFGCGQTGIISCLAFTQNYGGLYALGSFGRTVGIYSEQDGLHVCILQGHSGGVTQVAFSKDGTKIYSGARKDNLILCWDLRNTETVLHSYRREVTTNQKIQFNIDRTDSYLISGNTNGLVSVWPLENSEDEDARQEEQILCHSFAAHADAVNGVSFHPYLPLMASSSGQRHFILRNSGNDSDSDDGEGQQTADESIENSLRVWSLHTSGA